LQDIVSNLKELLKSHPVKFAGNVPIAQPVWAGDKNMGSSQIVSFAVHGGLALLLFIPFMSQLPRPIGLPPGMRTIYAPDPHELRAYLFHPNALPNKGGGGGGGGERNPIPESIGRRPDLSSVPQIIPPSVPRNENAALQLKTNLEGQENPNIPNTDMNRWGNPLANAITNSNGPGKGHGIGKGDGNGVGDGKGTGFDDGEISGHGGNRPSVPGNGVTYPSCQYCPRPDYSEEARKVKYSGSVMLNVIVLANGKTGRIEVVNSPGMGLDEKAVEAVRGWMFRPGVGPNGKPVATIVAIEVVFQLF
jgi:protein TonB